MRENFTTYSTNSHMPRVEGTYRVINTQDQGRERVAKRLQRLSLSLVLLSLLVWAVSGLNFLFGMLIFLSFILGMVTLLFPLMHDPTQHTVIEIFPEKIIRRGEGLTTATLLWQELGPLYEDESGILLRKADLNTSLAFFNSDLHKIREKNIVFIPRQLSIMIKLNHSCCIMLPGTSTEILSPWP